MKSHITILLAALACLSQIVLAEEPVQLTSQKTKSRNFQEKGSIYSPEQIRELETMATQGNSDAQCSLSICYGKGKGVGKDYDKAFYWATKAAQQNNPEAYSILFTCYYQGFGCKKDLQKAVQCLEKGASLGDSNCQYNLAYFTYYGKIGIKKNPQEALKWALQASHQGYVDALRILSLIYIDGKGVERNVPLALKYLEQAAHESSNPEYYTELGEVYLSLCQEDNPLASLDKAEQAFIQAAKLGNSQAEKRCREIQQLRANISRLQQEMQPRDKDALFKLGQLYIQGIDQAPLDRKKGFQFIRDAADLGSPEAQCLLGEAYMSGEGVKKDIKQGILWLQKSATQGHAGAQNYLGVLYLVGEGVERNEKKAFQWIHASAMQNEAIAQYNMGGLYMEGLGVEKNYQQAAKWYRKAAEQGNKEAKEALKKIKEEKVPIKEENMQ